MYKRSILILSLLFLAITILLSSCADETDSPIYQDGFEAGYDFAYEDLEPEIDASIETIYDACERFKYTNLSMKLGEMNKIGKYNFSFQIDKDEYEDKFFSVKYSVDGFNLNSSLKKSTYEDGSFSFDLLNEENDNIFSCLFFKNSSDEIEGYYDHIFNVFYIDDEEKNDLIKDGFITTKLKKFSDESKITTAVLFLDINSQFYKITILLS